MKEYKAAIDIVSSEANVSIQLIMFEEVFCYIKTFICKTPSSHKHFHFQLDLLFYFQIFYNLKERKNNIIYKTKKQTKH